MAPTLARVDPSPLQPAKPVARDIITDAATATASSIAGRPAVAAVAAADRVATENAAHSASDSKNSAKKSRNSSGGGNGKSNKKLADVGVAKVNTNVSNGQSISNAKKEDTPVDEILTGPFLLDGTLCYSNRPWRRHIIRGNWKWPEWKVPNYPSVPSQPFELTRTIPPEEELSDLPKDGEFEGSFNKNEEVAVAEWNVKLTFKEIDDSNGEKFSLSGSGNNRCGPFTLFGTAIKSKACSSNDPPTFSVSVKKYYVQKKVLKKRPKNCSKAKKIPSDDATQKKKSSASKGNIKKGHTLQLKDVSKKSSPANMTEEEEKEKVQFLIFSGAWMKYLKRKDDRVHINAMAVMRECYEKNKSGDPQFKSLTKIMKLRLRAAVGELYWKQGQGCVAYFLKKKRAEQVRLVLKMQKRWKHTQQENTTNPSQHQTTSVLTSTSTDGDKHSSDATPMICNKATTTPSRLGTVPVVPPAKKTADGTTQKVAGSLIKAGGPKNAKLAPMKKSPKRKANEDTPNRSKRAKPKNGRQACASSCLTSQDIHPDLECSTGNKLHSTAASNLKEVLTSKEEGITRNNEDKQFPKQSVEKQVVKSKVTDKVTEREKQNDIIDSKQAALEKTCEDFNEGPRQKANEDSTYEEMSCEEQEALSQSINDLPEGLWLGAKQIISESDCVNDNDDEIDLDINQLEPMIQRKLQRFVMENVEAKKLKKQPQKRHSKKQREEKAAASEPAPMAPLLPPPVGKVVAMVDLQKNYVAPPRPSTATATPETKKSGEGKKDKKRKHQALKVKAVSPPQLVNPVVANKDSSPSTSHRKQPPSYLTQPATSIVQPKDISRESLSVDMPEEEQKEKEWFLMFTKALMEYLEQNDAQMHTDALAAMEDCYEKNKSGDPQFKSLTESMKARLRTIVGEHYWKKAHGDMNHFLKQKREDSLTKAGGPNDAELNLKKKDNSKGSDKQIESDELMMHCIVAESTSNKGEEAGLEPYAKERVSKEKITQVGGQNNSKSNEQAAHLENVGDPNGGTKQSLPVPDSIGLVLHGRTSETGHRREEHSSCKLSSEVSVGDMSDHFIDHIRPPFFYLNDKIKAGLSRAKQSNDAEGIKFFDHLIEWFLLMAEDENFDVKAFDPAPIKGHVAYFESTVERFNASKSEGRIRDMRMDKCELDRIIISCRENFPIPSLQM